MAEASVLKLFIAGIVPGFLLAGGYMIYLAVRAVMDPTLVPAEEPRMPILQRPAGLRHLLPVVFLILAVLGSMYGGFASPSEAAAVGVLGALLVSALQRTLTLRNLKLARLGAVQTVSLIGLIVAGTCFLSITMEYFGVPRILAGQIAALGLSPIALIMQLL